MIGGGFLSAEDRTTYGSIKSILQNGTAPTDVGVPDRGRIRRVRFGEGAIERAKRKERNDTPHPEALDYYH